ncbi:MAG: MMPL family transporter [Chitinispirillales bacterium]|jgi:predicted RND superfamily exporter protein|nr:MMPL family transporter [Chitinispirillales bacterium]
MPNFKEEIIFFAIKHRKFSALVILLMTAFFAYNLKNISVDNNAAHAIPDTLQQVRDVENLRSKFNSPYSIFLMAQFDKDSPLYEKIEIFDSWAQKFSEIQIDGVKGFESIVHIGTLKVPVEGGIIGIKSASISKEKNDETLREIIRDNFALTGNFISTDEKTLLMILYTNDNAERPKTISAAMKILDGIRADGYEHTYITGATTTSWYMSRDMNRDLSILLPFSILIAALLLFWMFENLRCVAAPLVIVVFSVIWTLGIMALANVPLNVLTSVIPLILLPVGLAGSLHIIKSYRQNRFNGLDFDDAFAKTYRDLLGPIFIAAATTFFGFSSFTVSSLSWTRYFGFFTGLGIVIALFLSVFFLPIFFTRFEKGATDNEPKNLIPLSFFNNMVFKYPFSKILLLLVIVFSIIFVPKIKFDSNPISFFDKNHELRKSDDIVQEQFGGTRFFDIMIESDTEFSDSASWQNLSDIIDWIKEIPEIGSVTSVFPVLNRVSEILKGTPISQTAVSLMLNGNMTKNEDGSNLLDAWLTSDKKAVKITLACKNIPLYNYTNLSKKITSRINQEHPNWKITASGEVLLMDSMIDLLIRTQTYSLLITFLLIALSLVILFRSFFVGIFSSLPIIIGACFIAGIMAASGITINIVTVIVVNCCIGIGIDYAIHFTSSFLRLRKKGAVSVEALLGAFQDKSTVIIFNTLAVGIGFLVLCLSNFPPVRALGFLIFLSMTVGSIFSLLFLPVFLNRKGK